MLDTIAKSIVTVADTVCGYPLFFLLIGGGLYLMITSGAVSLRRLPASVRVLREPSQGRGEISSVQALLSAVAGTVGLGNIAGVAIALVMGGPGAIFWMWVSALVGMGTKFHEGTLAVMYRPEPDADGRRQGGMMHIIERGLGHNWRPLARFFAVAGMFGTLCIININQLTEAAGTMVSANTAIDGGSTLFKLTFGIIVAVIVAVVVLRGVRRIARVAQILVPFMVGVYFLMVLYIILTHLGDVPGVFRSIFSEAFNLRAGFGAFAGIAIIGARRAALVNDAGIGTASIMHGASRNERPVREGLVAMLGPALDSGLVCTLTALALLLCVDFAGIDQGVKGLEVAIGAFASGIPYGEYILMAIIVCFALSSMFSYSYYGTSCAAYLFGPKRAKYYTWGFIVSLVLFAVIPLGLAVSLCDLFYACMAFPAMFTILALSRRVHAATRDYFSKSANPAKSANSAKQQ